MDVDTRRRTRISRIPSFDWLLIIRERLLDCGFWQPESYAIAIGAVTSEAGRSIVYVDYRQIGTEDAQCED
jgi:hypothetical protein